MLMPGKHLRQQDSVIYLAGFALSQLNQPMSVSELWEVFRRHNDGATFERYTLAMGLLHMMELVAFSDDGLLVRERTP